MNIEDLNRKIKKLEGLDKTHIEGIFELIDLKTDENMNLLIDKIDALSRKVDTKFDYLEQKFDTKFDYLEQKFDTKFDYLEQKFDTKFDSLNQKLDTSIEKVYLHVDYKIESSKNQIILWTAAIIISISSLLLAILKFH